MGRTVFTEHWSPHHKPSRELVYEELSKAGDHELTVSELSRRTGLSWPTVRRALLELMLQGKVEGRRMGNALLFRLKKGVK